MEHFDLSCSCGSENFERVVVRRLGQSDYLTDFVACVLCKVMFHLPKSRRPVDPTFKRDAAIAAKARQPGPATANPESAAAASATARCRCAASAAVVLSMSLPLRIVATLSIGMT